MMSRLFPPLLSFILLFLFLEFGARFQIIDPTLIPAPSQIAKVFTEMPQSLGKATLETARNILIGWCLSILLGNLIAFCFSLSNFLKRAILPYAIFFQTVPIIAIAPLMVIYFGFGAPTVIISSFIVSIFPIIANTLLGLENIRPEQLELFAIYKATRWQILTRLRLPSAYASIYAGLKVSAGLAVIGAVAGEFVAGSGLGALIDSARTQQRIDIVFAAILILSALGLALILLLKLLNSLFQMWRPWSLSLKD